MVNTKRSMLLVFSISLLLVVGVSSFSSRPFNGIEHKKNILKNNRDVEQHHDGVSYSILYAEPYSCKQSSSIPYSSRRGFIRSCCVATTAAAATISSTYLVSPANAIQSSQTDTSTTQHSNDNINSIIASTSSSQKTSSATSDDDKDRPITALQESISGFVSGTAVSTVKTLIKYPLDTATVRLQMPNTQYTIQNLPKLFAGSFDGITAPLLSNIPAGAIFFAVKDATKSSLKGSGVGLPKWALTSLAVGAALPPYWLIRNPSEVIKTRLQVGADGYYEGMSTYDAFKLALSKNGSNSTADTGVSELYQGYTENILYGFPADIIKFVAYDNFTGGRGKKNISPGEGAVYGALSTAIAQLVTTPLDVLRNRIMADVSNEYDDDSNQISKNAEVKDLSYIDRLVKIAKEEGVEELFAGSTPRIAKAMLSGAIQFATYEETKTKMSEMFIKRR